MVRKYVKLVDPTGYKGGNYTRGENRRGYRGGRKPRVPGAIIHTAALKLTDQEYATAAYLGVGNISAGLRLALSVMRPYLLPHVKDTRFDAWTALQTQKISIKRTVDAAVALLTKPEWDDLA